MLLALAALTLVYSILLWVGVLHSLHHLHLVLLAFQYLLLLPVILKYLRSHKNGPAEEIVAPKRLRLIAALFALATLSLSWLSTRGLLNPDESGYSFEARILLTGHLKSPPLIGATDKVRDTPRELFFENHVLRPDGWFPKFPPGWPLVLAAGYAVSAPWILTPILAILSLITIAALGSHLFSPQTGMVAVCIAALSSFYLVNSIGMMSHALCALLSAVACYCLFRGLESRRIRFFCGMFACLGYALQVRPYTAFVLAVVMTAAAIWETRNDPQLVLRIFGVGCLIGGLALAAVLLYNRLYTGSWLVSPYALAVGSAAPPELSFNPVRILRGIAQYGTQTLEESLIGLFPFTYLLAAYALFTETERRREVWILAAIYLSLVLAYLAHPQGSGVFFGERFHFEGIYAVLLLAARGAMLLFQRWRVSRQAAISVFGLLAILQLSQQTTAALTVARNGEPFRKIRTAALQAPAGVVFLSDSSGFLGKHFNLNDPDWPHASHIFLVDADRDHRNAWACRYHAATWTVAQYDPTTHSAILTSQPANCAAVNP